MDTFRIKLDQVKYKNEKRRFLLFALLLFITLFASYSLFKYAYARYETSTRLVADIDKALYIFNSDTVTFNLDPNGIIPRNDPYTYRFSVANFTESKMSDVDLSYTVRVRTTTNLPLTIQLYRNELPTDSGAINLLSGCTNVQDEDGAWYHVYDVHDDYMMDYAHEITDYYTLVIYFPATYASDMTYVNGIENIEVTLESKQMV